VGYAAWVKGKVSGPTRDAEPRLLVHPIVRGSFSSHGLKLNSKGNFKERINFGINAGEEFVLILVFTPKFTSFHNLKDELPEEVLILDQRRVMRK
jgi:hypothetical protein